MKRALLSAMSILALLSTLLIAAAPVGASSGDGLSNMPPNPDKIAAALVKRGAIPANATPQQKDAILSQYLQTKLKGSGQDKEANPLARKQLDAREESLNSIASSDLRGRKLGNTTQVSPSSPRFMDQTSSDKLLLILVDFSDQSYTWTPAGQSPRTASGPLHNNIPVPDNDFDLYVNDFSTQHYEDMLFTPGGWTFPADSPRYANEHRGSMRDFYLQQSYGKYTVDGKAYGWFTVGKPEAYYGDDNPAGGNDNLGPGNTASLIADAVNVVNSQNAINWAEYDTNNDCVIDHPLFIHAGVDQSGGGGAQGDDAIWAHSSSVNQVVGTTTGCPNGLRIENYTIMPEDGGVGVFAHEFGHDLGLPDEYDTIYSGRGDSVAYWSLMSAGSWVGRPAQTQPANISIWGRMALGWLTAGDNLAVTSLDKLGKTPTGVRLEQSELWGGAGTINAIRVNLPPKQYYVNTPHSGVSEWFGGKADQIDTTLRRAVDLTGKTSASLSFWTWYDIEQNWDFGFVQVSADGGATWKSLPIAGTTSVIDPDGMPAIAAQLPGLTGNSGGWVQKTFDLKDYVGKNVLLQFRYMTDWGTTMAGFYVDDVSVTADGSTLFADNVETADPAWTVAGWERNPGGGAKPQYYMLEWRNTKTMETLNNGASIVNSDAGLQNVYQFDPYAANPNQPLYYSYSPGLVLWYRDQTFTDNWTGVHPGGGYLLVVDAHDQALLRPPYPKYGSLPWNSNVQTSDAAFGLKSIASFALSYWGTLRTYPKENAVPAFDDSHSYWTSVAPAASVKTPTFGLVFRVLGQAADGSAAAIGLGLK